MEPNNAAAAPYSPNLAKLAREGMVLDRHYVDARVG